MRITSLKVYIFASSIIWKGDFVIRITNKSKLQTSDSMQAMLAVALAVVIISATLIVGAAVQFNGLTLSIVSVFFQMLTLGALLLISIFLVRIEQKGIKNK
ncbi:Uncharacterised protein [uncultured archaeon]|nr:Uncharacterised protein [uncultured archaeon]